MVSIESMSLADIGRHWREKVRERLIQANDPSIIIRADCVFYDKLSAMKNVNWTNTTVDGIRKLIEEMKTYYSAPGGSFSWDVADFDKPDSDKIKDLLVKSGFVNIIENEELMFRLTSANVKEILELYTKFQQSTASFTIKELNFLARLDKNIANIQIQSFPTYFTNYNDYKQFALEIEKRFKLMGNTNHYYVASINEIPVGDADLFVMKIDDVLFGYLGGAAVLPDYRKQGIYTALLQKRIIEAYNAGIKILQVSANKNTSASALKKHGFEIISTNTMYQYTFNDTGT